MGSGCSCLITGSTGPAAMTPTKYVNSHPKSDENRKKVGGSDTTAHITPPHLGDRLGLQYTQYSKNCVVNKWQSKYINIAFPGIPMKNYI